MTRDPQVGASRATLKGRMTQRSYRHWIATGLSHAVLADLNKPSGATAPALRARMRNCLGADGEWLQGLADSLARYLAARRGQDTVATLADHLQTLPAFDSVLAREEGPPRIRRLLLRPARMAAAPPQLAALQLPALPTLADLAAWLDLDLPALDWLVGRARDFREPAPPGRAPAQHYHALLKPKRSGGLRLIEVPKPELKRVQRRLLSGLLAHVPVHESAHGFVSGRSVLSHAAVHANSPVVLAYDLRDFFNSVGVARVRALWRTLGYPEPVAAALASLCTARTPAAVRERLLDSGSIDWLGAKRLQARHLPQGAPTSPALANLCAFGLDLRLGGLAWRFGASYSRYADDLVFSGPAELMQQRRALQAWVDAVVRAEGFALNASKSRAMPRHRRQRVTGVVVNERPNLERGAYDVLRARLHRLAETGCDAATLTRLQGEVSWALQLVCATRAGKLQRLLAAIPLALYDGQAHPTERLS